jgi:hypothetical protein
MMTAAKMKNGTASSVYELMPLSTRSAIIVIGIPPTKSDRKADMIIAAATDTPSRRKTMKDTKRTVSSIVTLQRVDDHDRSENRPRRI